MSRKPSSSTATALMPGSNVDFSTRSLVLTRTQLGRFVGKTAADPKNGATITEAAGGALSRVLSSSYWQSGKVDYHSSTTDCSVVNVQRFGCVFDDDCLINHLGKKGVVTKEIATRRLLLAMDHDVLNIPVAFRKDALITAIRNKYEIRPKLSSCQKKWYRRRSGLMFRFLVLAPPTPS